MAMSFSVSPMSQTLTLAPGEVVTGSIKVINPSDSTENLSYKVTVVPYNVNGEDYTIDTSSVQTFSQIAEWTKLENASGTLAPNETQEIKFTITVPEGAPAGGQSMALIVSEDSDATPQTGVGVSSAFSMGSVVYANITGETTTGGEILSNSVPNFTTSTPVSVSATVENTGNVYEPANITLTVTNNLTGEKILSADSENGNHFTELILPQTTRRITRQIDNLPTVGIVHIEQSVLFEGQTSIVSQELFICPVWFMALFIAILVAIIGGIIFFVKRRKRRKTAL